MSRSYPFPPPGYVLKETGDESSLIESIKVAKDEIKREKKDRSRKKDEKRKEKKNEADGSRKHRHKRRRKDVEGKKVNDHRGLLTTETELLEKSSLTVELELQTSSQNSCDSTLQSNEIPEQSHTQSRPLDGRHNDSEIDIRIRLHGNEKDHEVMMTSDDQNQCLDASQAGPSELVGQTCSTSANEVPQDALSGCQDVKSPETNGKISTKPKMPASITGTSKLCRKCRPSIAVQLVNLIENWTPDGVKSNLINSEDQEWWMFKKFGSRRHDQVINQTTSNASSFMVWPAAQYLPEVELHALPFTVPF